MAKISTNNDNKRVYIQVHVRVSDFLACNNVSRILWVIESRVATANNTSTWFMIFAGQRATIQHRTHAKRMYEKNNDPNEIVCSLWYERIERE